MQARVDGVQHPTRAADAEIHLHVAIAIPGQAGHSVALGQAHGIELVGKLARARSQFLVGIAVDIALHTAGDDLPVGMVARGKLDQGRNQQRLALHQTQHWQSPG